MPGGRPKEFDVSTALERAMEYFWARGYEGSSLSDLLVQMGISRQSLYDTFGSKRALFIRAIEHYRATRLTQALGLLTRDGSRLENVRAVVRYFEDLAGDDRCRGCLVANTLVELGPHDPEIAALLHETLGILRDSIERTLSEARASGELSPSKSPRELASALTNSVIGMAVTGRLQIPTSTLGEICSGTLSMLD